MIKLKNIKDLTRKQLRDWLGEKTKMDRSIQSYRADQVFFWLYQKGVNSFAEMKNLGFMTRSLLEKHFFHTLSF